MGYIIKSIALCQIALLGVAACSSQNLTGATISSEREPDASGVIDQRNASVRVANDDELNKMAYYLHKRNDPRIIAETISTTDTESVDCVYTHLQHGYDRPFSTVASPPAPDVAATAAISTVNTEVVAQQRYGTVTKRCPTGTIPRLRVDIQTLTHFASLEEYFRKSPTRFGPTTDPSLASDPGVSSGARAGAHVLMQGPTDLHQYVAYDDSVTNIGSESILNVWNPPVERSSEFSLSQIWVSRGEGASLETVEAGSQVYPDMYGSNARLFVLFTPDNYGPGGCYNLDCDAFVQTSNTYALGASFANYSVPNGSQYFLPVRLQIDTNGNWWVAVNGTWLGYWPASLFDANGLANGASRVTYGGEILDSNVNGVHTTSDMGSGFYAYSGYSYAAYQRNMRYYYGSPAAPSVANAPASTAIITGAGCYGGSTAFDAGSWGRYMYFGGPGYNIYWCE